MSNNTLVDIHGNENGLYFSIQYLLMKKHDVETIKSCYFIFTYIHTYTIDDIHPYLRIFSKKLLYQKRK